MTNHREQLNRHGRPNFQKNSSRLRTSARVGHYYVVVLVAALAVLIAAFIFLTALWFSHDANPVWHQIALHGWFPRTITLTSVLIRSAVSATAGVCTAMLASIALENGEVSIHHAAAVAARTFTGGEAHGLLTVLVRSLSLEKMSTVFPLALLAGTTMLSQLCSTALISDLHSVQIPGSNQTAKFFYTYSTTSDIAENSLQSTTRNFPRTNILNIPQTEFPIFAEASSPEEAQISDGLHDTGPVVRAYLPLISSQDRGNLRNYSGSAFVVDHRVVCVRPDLTNLTMEKALTSVLGLGTSYNSAILTGSINPAIPIKVPHLDFTNIFAFECMLQTSGTSSHLGWQTVLCAGLPMPSGLRGQFRSSNPSSIIYGSTYIVLNATGDLIRFFQSHPDKQSWDLGDSKTTEDKATEYKEWRRVTVDDSFRFDVSLCTTALSAANGLIDAYIGNPQTEPTTPYQDGNPQTFALSAPLRDMLGFNASLFSPEQRGILQLVNRTAWDDPEVVTAVSVTRVINNVNADMNGQPLGYGDASLMLCAGCSCPVYAWNDSIIESPTLNCVSPTEDHSVIFQANLIESGGRPAYAIQGLLTSMVSQNYYASYPYFEQASQSQVTFFVQAIAPTEYGGYLAVTVVLALHIFVCFMVVVAFHMFTENYYLDKAWYSTVQLYNDQTKAIFLEASSIDPREVPKWSNEVGKIQKAD